MTSRAGAMPFGSAVSAARWGHRPVGALARVRDVRAVEDLSPPGAQHRFGDGGALAPGARREVQRRVVQDLQGDTGPALLERLARDGRGETAPGALSAHGRTAAVPAVLAAVLGDPPDDLEGLPGRGGERVLRGHDVVDVDHGHPRLGGKGTTERIVGLRQRHHVPATVEVDVNRRRRTLGRRQVHHDPGRSDRDRDRQLAHGAGEFGEAAVGGGRRTAPARAPVGRHGEALYRLGGEGGHSGPGKEGHTVPIVEPCRQSTGFLAIGGATPARAPSLDLRLRAVPRCPRSGCSRGFPPPAGGGARARERSPMSANRITLPIGTAGESLMMSLLSAGPTPDAGVTWHPPRRTSLGFPVSPRDGPDES